MLTGSVAFSIKKNRRTKRNQSIIKNLKQFKRLKTKQFKRLKTPQMSEGTQNRKETFLRERLESNNSMIEKTICQDEKDFTLEVPVNLKNNGVYGKGKKKQISLIKNYLVRQTRCLKQSW